MEATATNRSSAEQLREKTTQVRQDLRELSGVAKDVAAEKLEQWYKEGRAKVVRFEHSFEDQIRMHPLQSVAIAAGVGFLAGYLISRRSS